MLFVLVLAPLLLPVAQAKFSYYQNISTNGGNDAEFFELHGTYFLAWANANGNNTQIYTWHNQLWESASTLPCANCQGATFFEVSGSYFLALSAFNAATSPIFKWDESRNEFIWYQGLAISQPRKFKYTQVNGQFILAAAQQSNFVRLFEWDYKFERFEGLQNISVSNPQAVSFFTIESQTYLPVANGDGNASTIFVWTGHQFAAYQELPVVVEAQDTFGFRIESEYYLAVPTYNNATYVFIWNRSKFEVYQTITGIFQYNAAIPFYIGETSYLGIAADGPPPSYEAPSTVYQWNGTQFQAYQSVTTWFAQTLAYFAIDGTVYMATANLLEGDNWNVKSQIFAWIADN